jgi:hypothetical protein
MEVKPIVITEEQMERVINGETVEIIVSPGNGKTIRFVPEGYVIEDVKETITDKEVLQEAISIANEKGYFLKFSIRYNLDSYMMCRKYYSIIFSQDFAKAFWGEEVNKSLSDIISDYRRLGYLPNYPQGWQHHLQQMVLEENPIDYLRKFI